MANILIFGDSTTWGAWDIGGGWVQKLRQYVDEKRITKPGKETYVYNLGVSGDTTEDLIERFEYEAKSRLSKEETIIIFNIGLNDSQFLNDRESQRIEIKDFEENLKALINIARNFSKKIIFLGLNPVDEKKVDPMPWSPDKSYKQELVKKFNKSIKEVCKRNSTGFIDLFQRLVKEGHKYLLEDGAHPNAEGHQRIFEIVRDYLSENKII